MSIIHEAAGWGNYPPDPAVEVRLTGLLHESGQLFAVFTAGDAERIIDAELRDVIPFDNFRRRVLDRFGVRVVYKRGHWFRDVLAAAKRGGVTIEVDHLAQAIWVNEHSLPFAEAGYLAELMLSPSIYFEADLMEAGR